LLFISPSFHSLSLHPVTLIVVHIGVVRNSHIYSGSRFLSSLPVALLLILLPFAPSPSSDNVLGFAERIRVERGQFPGPRIFHTGDVIYGANEPGIHQEIVDMDEAEEALVRIKAEGGKVAGSYKNYNLPSR
jgi:hypothetical protein